MTREHLNQMENGGELLLASRNSLRNRISSGNFRKVNRWHILESISAQKVSDIWQRCFPTEGSPIELLSVADASIITADCAHELKGMLTCVKTLLDHQLLLCEEYSRAVYAGFACRATARNIAYGTSVISDDFPRRSILIANCGTRALMHH